MADTEPLTREEFNTALEDALTDPRTVRFRAEDSRIDLIVSDDLTLSLYSTREDPELTVKGGMAFATGSRLTLTRDDQEREVQTDDTVTLTLPAEPFEGIGGEA